MVKQISFYLESTASTNDYVKENLVDFSKNLPDLVFVHAGVQTKGRGRNGRRWRARKGSSVLASLLIRDPRYLDNPGLLSCFAAVTVAKWLSSFGVDAKIKWPNDIMVCDKKIAGILPEGRLPEYAIIGIGVNINQRRFGLGYRVPPTSLALCTGQAYDAKELGKALHQEFCDAFSGKGLDPEAIREKFKSRDYLEGKKIRYDYYGVSHWGGTAGVDKDFRLQVFQDDGALICLSSGEIKDVTVF